MRKLSSKLAGQQSGFTLIELVIVIVIIGILAAVAIPQFSELSGDANKAKAQGIAGAVNSAYATGLAVCSGKLDSCKATTSKDKTGFETDFGTCTKALALLEGTVALTGTGYAFTGASPPNCDVAPG